MAVSKCTALRSKSPLALEINGQLRKIYLFLPFAQKTNFFAQFTISTCEPI